jgi:Arc/MetJ family transcription regulator
MDLDRHAGGGQYCPPMIITLNIDDSLLHRAAKLSGLKEKTALVRLGLEALIKQSARRLAELGGTKKALQLVGRRRSGIAWSL